MDVRDPRLVRSQDLTFSIIFCQEDFAFTQSSAPLPLPLPPSPSQTTIHTHLLYRDSEIHDVHAVVCSIGIGGGVSVSEFFKFQGAKIPIA